MSLCIGTFNSTRREVQSLLLVTSASDLQMRTIKFCTVLHCTLRRIAVDPRCHKQDSPERGAAAFVDRGRRTTHSCYNLYSAVEMVAIRDGPAVIDAKARYWSKIAIFAQVR